MTVSCGLSNYKRLPMVLRRILLTICLLSLATAFAAAESKAPPTGKGPVRGFLLLGQSNMNGRGNIKVLNDKITRDPPEKYPPALTKMRTDVWITGANGNGVSNQKINLKKDKAYSVYNASGDGTHRRHNGRAYLDVGYWSAELMKPMLAKTAKHAVDEKVQAALKKYGKIFERGNAANKDPIYEAFQKRWGGRPPMKTAGGNNIKRKK